MLTFTESWSCQCPSLMVNENYIAGIFHYCHHWWHLCPVQENPACALPFLNSLRLFRGAIKARSCQRHYGRSIAVHGCSFHSMRKQKSESELTFINFQNSTPPRKTADMTVPTSTASTKTKPTNAARRIRFRLFASREMALL